MTATVILKGLWYPMNPPTLPGETADDYTNRLLGAQGEARRPYSPTRADEGARRPARRVASGARPDDTDSKEAP